MKSITEVVQNLLKPYIDNKDLNESKSRSILGAHNILFYDLAKLKALNTRGTWVDNVYTDRGISYTINSDMSITVNGTASSTTRSELFLLYCDGKDFALNKNVILTGCPLSGATNTYYIMGYRLKAQDGSGSSATVYDVGSGVTFDYLNDASGTVGYIKIAVESSIEMDNKLFKPMLRLSTDSNPEYSPAVLTNEQLEAEINTLTTGLASTNSNVSALDTALDNEVDARAVLGAHNILWYDLARLKVLNTVGTWNDNVYTRYGVDFTVNDDMTITVNGTNSEETTCMFFISTSNASVYALGKNVTMTGCPSGGSSSSYYLQAAYIASQDGSTGTKTDFGNGVTFDYLNDGSGTRGNIRINVEPGTTVDHLVFKPMLRLSDDANTDYQKPTLSNETLTDEVIGVKAEKISISDLKTVVAASSDFADFQTRIAAL